MIQRSKRSRNRSLKKRQMNTSTKQLQNDLDTEYEYKPITTHISYKQHEKNLLVMEQRLMKHYAMNRSDLHKHFLRNAYNTLGHLFQQDG